jgi:hypothetical protein
MVVWTVDSTADALHLGWLGHAEGFGHEGYYAGDGHYGYIGHQHDSRIPRQENQMVQFPRK